MTPKVTHMIAPKTTPAIWPMDRLIFVDVDGKNGASVGARVSIVLSLEISAMVVNVTVAVFEITIVVRLDGTNPGNVLDDWK